MHKSQIKIDWHKSYGSYPYTNDWYKNPQIRFSLTNHNRNSSITIVLEYVHTPNSNKIKPPLGFYLIRHFGGLYRQQLCLDNRNSIINYTNFNSSGKVSLSLDITSPLLKKDLLSSYLRTYQYQIDQHYPSHYMIIPCTDQYYDDISSLQLTIYSQTDVFIRPIEAIEQCILLTSIQSSWNKINAGGCINHLSFKNNQKFILSTTTTTKLNIIQDLYIILRQDINKCYGIGLYIYDKNNQLITKSQFMNSIEQSVKFQYDGYKAPYTIIPCTFKNNQYNDYTLHIYTTHILKDIQFIINKV